MSDDSIIPRIRRLIEEDAAYLIPAKSIHPTKLNTSGSVEDDVLKIVDGRPAWGAGGGGGGAGLSDDDPLIDGTAYEGVSSEASRSDHVHPTDTSRASDAELAAEAATRAAADTTLQTNINTEATTRANADIALDGRLDILEAIDYATQVELDAATAARALQDVLLLQMAEDLQQQLDEHHHDERYATITALAATTATANTANSNAATALTQSASAVSAANTAQAEVDAEEAARALNDVLLRQQIDDNYAAFEEHHHDGRYLPSWGGTIAGSLIVDSAATGGYALLYDNGLALYGLGASQPTFSINNAVVEMGPGAHAVTDWSLGRSGVGIARLGVSMWIRSQTDAVHAEDLVRLSQAEAMIAAGGGGGGVTVAAVAPVDTTGIWVDTTDDTNPAVLARGVTVRPSGLIVSTTTNLEVALALYEQSIDELRDSLDEHVAQTTTKYKIGHLTVPGSIGNYAVTGCGFRPSMVEFSASMVNLQYGVAMTGVMDAAGNQWAHAMIYSEIVGAVEGDALTTRCITLPSDGGAASFVAANYVSMDADGFTINFTEVNVNFVVGWKAFR